MVHFFLTSVACFNVAPLATAAKAELGLSDSQMQTLVIGNVSLDWLTDKSFSDYQSRPALKVRANEGKPSQEDWKGLLTRFNGFPAISPDFNHGRVSNKAISFSRLLSVNPVSGCARPHYCRYAFGSLWFSYYLFRFAQAVADDKLFFQMLGCMALIVACVKAFTLKEVSGDHEGTPLPMPLPIKSSDRF